MTPFFSQKNDLNGKSRSAILDMKKPLPHSMSKISNPHLHGGDAHPS
jgi:hypothetical protein